MIAPVIDLSHPGTGPALWHHAMRNMGPWIFDANRHRRLVVAAPHPDDETLGAGGIIAEASRRGLPVVVVSLTDGEAATDEVGLGDRRHGELLASLRCLAPPGVQRVVRCRLPDGGLSERREELIAILRSETDAGDLLLAPLYCDGHPDHDAVGTAALSLAAQPGIDVGFFPIWAWHWHDPSVSVVAAGGRRIELSPASSAAKARALACFVSQTCGADPVLPAHFLDRFGDSYEVVVQP